MRSMMRRTWLASVTLALALTPGWIGAQTATDLATTQTPATGRVLEILQLVERWDPDTAAAYVARSYAPAFHDAFPGSAHLDFLASIQELAGGARVEVVEEHGEREARAIVYSPVLDSWRELRLEVEAAPPHRITAIRPLRRAPPPAGRTVAPVTAAALDAYIERLAGADLFSGGVLASRRGEVVFRGAYGQASREFEVANSPDTGFILGSINKMFTAVAILQLVERGDLGLDDAVLDHLPGVLPDDVAQRITVRHLLTHTSGLGDFLFTPDMWHRNRADYRAVTDYLPLLGEASLSFEPGTGWRYSNAGFLVLGAILERVTGQDYHDYVRDRVLAPAGMSDTGSPELDRVPRYLASTYERVYENGRPAMLSDRYNQVVRGTPAGGGFSTLADMERFARALMEGRLLHPETVREMLRTRTEVGSAQYGFGAQIFADGWVGHTGGGPGTANYFAFRPETGEVVVVLGNLRGETTEVADRARELLAAPSTSTGLALTAAAGMATAQTHDGHAGKETRDVKALSAEEMAGLLAGEGMGQALAAELNGWPGPRHVLELVEQLGVTPEAVTQLRAIRDRMQADAIRLGQEYIDLERQLDMRFANRHIDEDVLATLTAEIGRLQSAIRYVHLWAHLETSALLTPQQVRRYQELRGYMSHEREP